MAGRRRYVLRGVPGGWRIWDNKRADYWGDLYQVCPEELVIQLNDDRSSKAIVDLVRKSRRTKR
jgi:hypothetical protein